jgi:hypothetical protein
MRLGKRSITFFANPEKFLGILSFLYELPSEVRGHEGRDPEFEPDQRHLASTVPCLY